MGEALIKGLLESGTTQAGNIMVADPDSRRCEHLHTLYGIGVSDGVKTVALGCNIIILAVKPQVLDKVLGQYQDHLGNQHLIISIIAGVPMQFIQDQLPGTRVVRVMPNTPALVLAGASCWCGAATLLAEDRVDVNTLLSAIGTCHEVQESLMDAVTGLSGSGPGYIFTIMEALIDGGVLAGIPRPLAEQLVLQTVYGSAKLALDTGEPVGVLRGKVTSPAGTTIAGIQVLEEAGLRGSLMAAVAAATERSRELGS